MAHLVGSAIGNKSGLALWLAASYACGLMVPGIAISRAGPHSKSVGVKARIPLGSKFSRTFKESVAMGIESSTTNEYLARWAAGALSGWGYATFFQEVPLAGAKLPARNVVAVYPGESQAIVLVMAPLEPGHAAYARAFGTAMGLAQILAIPRTNTIAIFLEGGSSQVKRGAQVFARSFSDRGRIVGAIGIGPLSSHAYRVGESEGFDLPKLNVGSTGQPDGFAPIWLRRTAEQAASVEKLSAIAPFGLFELSSRALNRSSGPHGPLLAAGVPAITYESATDRYASTDDVMDLGLPSQIGKTLLRIVKGFDVAEWTPTEPTDAVALDRQRMLPRWAFDQVSWSAFFPLWISAVIATRSLVGKRLALRLGIGQFLIRTTPLAVAGLTLQLLRVVTNSLIPWIVALVVGFVSWVGLIPARRFLARIGTSWVPGVATASPTAGSAFEAIEILALSLASILTLATNPFAAVILLLPVAWLWPLARRGPSAALLIPLGGTVGLLLILAVTVGAHFPWDWVSEQFGALANVGSSLIATLSTVLVLGAGAGALVRNFR